MPSQCFPHSIFLFHFLYLKKSSYHRGSYLSVIFIYSSWISVANSSGQAVLCEPCDMTGRAELALSVSRDHVVHSNPHPKLPSFGYAFTMEVLAWIFLWKHCIVASCHSSFIRDVIIQKGLTTAQKHRLCHPLRYNDSV